MEVVHIEHGIRGQDSFADANYVENLCKEYGVPFHLVSCDIKKMAQESSPDGRGGRAESPLSGLLSRRQKERQVKLQDCRCP